MQYEYTEYSPYGLEMLEKQELCKDYMQGLEPCWKLCDAPFLALWERESRHFNDESTSNVKLTNEDNHIKIIVFHHMRDKEYKEQELYIFLVFQNNYGILIV